MEDDINKKQNNSLIDNINSLYILKHIFNFIKDTNFKYKIFRYSKKYFNNLELNIIKLKEEYLKKINFNLDNYLIGQKEILLKEYQNFLLEKKINKEILENIIYDIYENKDINEEDKNKEYYDYKSKICIGSPLFDILSKTKNFDKIFTLYFNQGFIDKYNLKDYYSKIFDNLNKSNIKYSSIFCYLFDVEKIIRLKQLNIDFNKIKRLSIDVDRNRHTRKSKIKCFFQTLFSINNIEINLNYLNITFIEDYKVSHVLFENINNFKNLKYLLLHFLHFDQNIYIKLNTLKYLKIYSCRNIKIAENSNENLEKINYNFNELIFF